MPLEKLDSLRASGPSSSGSKGARRIPAVLFPAALALAFLAVFALMFGARLLPAREVKSAPVITLRASSDSAVDSQPAPAGPQALLFQASGWVEPDPYIVNVPTLVNGVIDEVHVLEGQEVQEDDLLATLIDDDAKLDVEEADRTLRTLDATQVAHCAELPVLNAEMHAIQQRILAEKALHAELLDAADRLAAVPAGSVPAQAVTQARFKADAQKAVIDETNAKLAGVLAKINKVDLQRIAVEAQIRAAQTDLARKQLALDRTRITAPMDGIVLNLHAAPGKKRMLEGEDPRSALVVELYDPESLQARIDVPLNEAAALRVGQSVRLTTDLLPDAKFDGKVTRIVGAADLQRNTLQAKVKILNPHARLRPEMLVRAEFFAGGSSTSDANRSTSVSATAGGPSRLTMFAPKEALFDLAGNSARAWVVEDARARPRSLELGPLQRDGHVQVVEGLRPGDQVILPPHEQLSDGTRIKTTD